jgi:hypothetical protein
MSNNYKHKRGLELNECVQSSLSHLLCCCCNSFSFFFTTTNKYGRLGRGTVNSRSVKKIIQLITSCADLCLLQYSIIIVAKMTV